MLKKLLAAILAAGMITSLCSCGTQTSGTEGNEDSDTHEPAETAVNEESDTPDGYRLAELNIPETAPYPNEEDYIGTDGVFDDEKYSEDTDAWYEVYSEKRDLQQIYEGRLDIYNSSVLSELLCRDTDENTVCSPLNIYFALAMLAEITDGESRQQVLSALGASDIDELRETAQALWQANYIDDGVLTSLLGASVWINESAEVKEEAVSNLALYYYATAYKGNPSDGGFSSAFRSWLNEQTNGLLTDQVEALPDFSEDMVMTIATTVYFKGTWINEFSDSMNVTETFNGTSQKTDTEFMTMTRNQELYTGDGFKAIQLNFINGAAMWLILPDEGTTPETIAAGSAISSFLTSDSDRESEYRKINLRLPKFDVSCTTDLEPVMQSLGISDVFNPEASDFTPLTDTDGVYVSSASHSARVKIDEQGCEAAAFTVFMATATAAFEEPEEFDFFCDRPFMFAVTGSDGQLLFTGIINNM